MARDIIHYDLPAIEKAANTFKTKADEVDSLMQFLVNEVSNLNGICSSDTVEAFAEAFNDVHVRALREMNEALVNVSVYLEKFAACVREGDLQGANALRIG